MNLRVLEYFVAVADFGSVTAAADAVRVSQPSVSRQLRGLEASLGVTLLQQHRNHTVLSATGKLFLPVARDLLARSDRARSFVAALAEGVSPPLQIIAPESTIEALIAPLVASEPDINVADVLSVEPTDVFHRIADGQADLGLSTVVPPGELESRRLVDAHIQVVSRIENDPFAPGSVNLSNLDAQKLIVMTRTHYSRIRFDEAAAEAGLDLSFMREMRSVAVAQALATAGKGFPIITGIAFSNVTPHPISHKGACLTVPLYAAWAPGHYADQAIHHLLDRLIYLSRGRESCNCAEV
ncbi:LysR family transcriptional regulator [Lysinibacter cavernae]|uniref:DNA-binding transcriptional LysR family regulator n=1 Tax=Lysinibacter cavernae TaxID=1640652 RepID=A0A7X5R0J5_9MICO|nr:LysR family transcriptional regulator [Lysinibacter cavernae]NIH53195.1 DNA-binding transcriptional LysR family regulator [Lysinibacter cavernae]